MTHSPSIDSSADHGTGPLGGRPLRAIIGPTATGKSAIALRVAELAQAEIIALDSMQVYRGMDIGTAKPSADERARVRHHMLDLVGPEERYDVQRYVADLRTVVDELARRATRALFVGGTGFYLKALASGLFEGPPIDRELRARIEERARSEGNRALHDELVVRDPASARRIHANDTKRLVRALEVLEQTGRSLSDWQREWGWHAGEARAPVERRLIGLRIETVELDRRIRERAAQMLDAGWIDEAVRIRDGAGFGPTAIQALGYRDVLELAEQRITRVECLDRIALATRQFARRQRTWYRKFDDIVWIDAPTETHAADAIDEHARAIVTAFGW